jgi:uncharacterized protein
LSSRIPYGSSVTEPALRQVEASEAFLKEEGFSIVRVRHYGSTAKIEVPIADLPALTEKNRWSAVVERLRSLGFQEVAADERGFASGRLNESIASPAGQNVHAEKKI